MKRLAFLLLSFSQFLIFPSLRADDNVGAVWTEVSATKALPHNLSIDLSAEHRTLNWFDWSSRWNVGAGLSYKLNKYVKFGVSYTFIRKHYEEETKYKYKGLDDSFSTYQGSSVSDDDGTVHKYKGYNVDAANWANRHRVAFDVMASMRFRKLLRISIRERYQYTHQAARDVDRTKYRDPSYDGMGNLTSFDDTTYTTDPKSAKDRHLLRSRVKFSIDKKGWKWEPYVSVETHNDFADKMHLDKVRTAVGVDYSINKSHKVGLAYVFNHENDDDGDQNIHAVCVGYGFKF